MLVGRGTIDVDALEPFDEECRKLGCHVQAHYTLDPISSGTTLYHVPARYPPRGIRSSDPPEDIQHYFVEDKVVFHNWQQTCPRAVALWLQMCHSKWRTLSQAASLRLKGEITSEELQIAKECQENGIIDV